MGSRTREYVSSGRRGSARRSAEAVTGRVKKSARTPRSMSASCELGGACTRTTMAGCRAFPAPLRDLSASLRRRRRSAWCTPSTGRSRTSWRRPGPATRQGHRHRGPGLGAARPPRRHRQVHLRGRAPHDVPARALPVRARERLAPVPLDVPARHPFYNSEQVSQRYVEVKPRQLRRPAAGPGGARALRDDGARASRRPTPG